MGNADSRFLLTLTSPRHIHTSLCSLRHKLPNLTPLHFTRNPHRNSPKAQVSVVKTRIEKNLIIVINTKAQQSAAGYSTYSTRRKWKNKTKNPANPPKD